MAEVTLTSAELAKRVTLSDLATTVQVHASRISSLREAIDDAIDFEAGNDEVLHRLTLAIDYLNLLQEAAEKVSEAGEQVELFALRSRLQ